MNDIREKIQRQGILPIIYTESIEQAVKTVEMLKKENLYVVDFPWRGERTAEVLREVSNEISNVQFGCSLLTTDDQVKQAVKQGAAFGFISALNSSLLKSAENEGMFVFPVASTLGEIDIAVKHGFNYICLAPITLIGGTDFIYQLKRMYPKVHFLPRGDIGTSTVEDYLSFSNVFACAGDWIAPVELMNNGAWESIQLRARDAIYAMLGFRIDSVEIIGASKYAKEVSRLQDIFGLSTVINEHFCSVGGKIVFVKNDNLLNKTIVLTISTNHIKRSVTYLQSKGYYFKIDEAPIDDNGRYPYVYLKNSIGGIEIKLLQKDSRVNQ